MGTGLLSQSIALGKPKPSGMAGFTVGGHLGNNAKNAGASDLHLNTDDALDESTQEKNLLSTPSSKNDDNDMMQGGSDNE